MKNRSLFNLIVLTLFILLISGCNKPYILSEPIDRSSDNITSDNIKTEEELPTQETPATSPMKIEMSFSNAPALNQNVKIITTITYVGRQIENMPETIAQIILPDGFEAVDGNLSWSGKVKRDEPVQFDITVKAVKIGNWTVEAKARSPSEGDAYIGGRDWIYVSVFEDKGIISENPFPLPKKEGKQILHKLNDSEILPNNLPINESMITPEPTNGDKYE